MNCVATESETTVSESTVLVVDIGAVLEEKAVDIDLEAVRRVLVKEEVDWVKLGMMTVDAVSALLHHHGTTLSMISEPLNLSELSNLLFSVHFFRIKIAGDIDHVNAIAFTSSIHPHILFVNKCMNHSDILTV